MQVRLIGETAPEDKLFRAVAPSHPRHHMLQATLSPQAQSPQGDGVSARSFTVPTHSGISPGDDTFSTASTICTSRLQSAYSCLSPCSPRTPLHPSTPHGLDTPQTPNEVASPGEISRSEIAANSLFGMPPVQSSLVPTPRLPTTSRSAAPPLQLTTLPMVARSNSIHSAHSMLSPEDSARSMETIGDDEGGVSAAVPHQSHAGGPGAIIDFADEEPGACPEEDSGRCRESMRHLRYGLPETTLRHLAEESPLGLRAMTVLVGGS